MKTMLRLATTAAPTPRTPPITGVSPARSRVRQTLSGLSQAYCALPMSAKSTWQIAANTLNQRQGRTGRRQISPANAYVTCNTSRLSVGLPVLPSAPADLSAPPLLPPLTAQAQIGDEGFTLTLYSPGYPHALLISASAPTPAGKTTFPNADFKIIGSLPALPNAPADIAALYQAAYGLPEPGAQIALKLVAISPAGLRLPPLILTALVA